MRTADRTPHTTVHFFIIRRCHENVCHSLSNALIYLSAFVAAETYLNWPFPSNGCRF
jgi:hypothetical protein